MRLADFDYHLPPGLIAQKPVRPRDRSRLLVLHRSTGRIEHRVFRDLPEYLQAGDLLLLNNTRVMLARLLGQKEGTGGKVEGLLLQSEGNGVWEALVSPGRRVPVGTCLVFGEEELTGRVIERTPEGTRKIIFSGQGELSRVLERLGQVPVPPYITRRVKDLSWYQTVYAERPGSSAAPTAGLHFTQRLLREIASRGVGLHFITLHVGVGTFRPIRAEEIEQHEMYPEWCEVPAATAQAANQVRESGHRLVAVGTTTARALEASVGPDERLQSFRGKTNLFIKPGYRFRAVEALVTNFHLPRSTLLLLVCAFAGRERVLRAYQEAVRSGYRFLSFGDAMLIV